MKFRVGDRVIWQDNLSNRETFLITEMDGRYAQLINMNTHSRVTNIEIEYINKWFIEESVYNSPLMKALKEEK